MVKNYRRSLFIFRRDLRVSDNTALSRALELSDEVIPCFIFDPRLADKNRRYFNHNAFQFLLGCLEDLKEQLKAKGGDLLFFSGLPEDVIMRLIQEVGINAVFFNRDYTPFSRKRDKLVAEVCDDAGIDMLSYHDALLHEPGTVLTKGGKPYLVFSQFFRKASRMEVPMPFTQDVGRFCSEKIHLGKGLVNLSDFSSLDKNELLLTKGGRSYALSILQELRKFVNYDVERDYPSMHGTTGLSAHNKLGTISIREFYYYVINELGPGHTLINELHWRDFFMHIAIEFPYVFNHAFKKKFDAISWSDNRELFYVWCSGQTGFPIVDAGMRELNSTGYMHNRVRMIVASFLVKDLHIDWRWGERYFASKLVDYDPCVNNGNWQWSASTGADSQPFFRIFNPWRQQRAFDRDCLYIAKWVPELAGLKPGDIHALGTKDAAEGVVYPRRIVEHDLERDVSLTMFKTV